MLPPSSPEKSKFLYFYCAIKCSLMSLRSSVMDTSMGQMPSTFLWVALAAYSSSIRTMERFLAATAKCIGVFPKESLAFGLARNLRRSLALS